MFEIFVDLALLSLLLLTAIAVLRVRCLMSAAILTGAYSLLAASLFMVLDAVDVAFTEAAVGAGVSTVFFLGALALTGLTNSGRDRHRLTAAFASLGLGAALVYASLDFPGFGDPTAPAFEHVSPRYLEQSAEEVGPPNVVTSVLASYRGFDTFGETAVVFTAAVGVLLLLGGGRQRR